MSTVHALSPRPPARDTVVCLHSSGSSGRQWASIAAALSPHFEVLAPDLLGYAGAPGWPVGKPVTLDAEASAVAEQIGPGSVHLFGHSYGGAVALQIALRWPQRVKSLTLYEPVRFGLLMRDPATRATGDDIIAVGRRIGQQVQAGRLWEAAQDFVDYWSGDGAWAQVPAKRRPLLTARMSKVHAEFEALFADGVPAAAYRALAMPVQLIGGSRSPLPARHVLGLLAAQWPRATRTTIAGLGHMGPVDAPQRVLKALAGPLQLPVSAAVAA